MKASVAWTLLGAAILAALTMASHSPASREGIDWGGCPPAAAGGGTASGEGGADARGGRGPAGLLPLVTDSFRLERRLAGGDRPVSRVTNTLLHSANSLLLWGILAQLAVPGAFLAAAVFALHPVNVEAAAMVCGRAILLASFLFLLAGASWMSAFGLGRGGSVGRLRAWILYSASMILFAGALTVSGITATLPAALLLVAWWKRGKVDRRQLASLFPMLLAGGAALFALRPAAVVGGIDWIFSPAERLLVAGRAFWFYAGKLVWPAGLGPLYSRWTVDAASWRQWLFPLGALLAAAALWLGRGRTGRGPLAAFLFYGFTLAPGLGFIDMPWMRYSFAADRFQYLAAVGPISLLSAIGATWTRRLPAGGRRGAAVAAALLLGVLSLLGWRQASTWRDEETLWRRSVGMNPESWVAREMLGDILLRQERYSDAAEQYYAALRVRPDLTEVRVRLADLLAGAGLREEAAARYYEAMQFAPSDAGIPVKMGAALEASGKPGEAEEYYRRALSLSPGLAEAHRRLGALLLEGGRSGEATFHLAEAVRLAPGLSEAHRLLGRALDREGKIREAADHYRRALAAGPGSPGTHHDLAMVLIRLGRGEEAAGHFDAAVGWGEPDDPDARNDLGIALAREGRAGEAVLQFEKALALKPGFASAHYNLGMSLEMTGRPVEAVEHYREAVKYDPRFAAAYNNLGAALAVLGKYDEAELALVEAIKLRGNYPEARDNLRRVMSVNRTLKGKAGHP